MVREKSESRTSETLRLWFNTSLPGFYNDTKEKREEKMRFRTSSLGQLLQKDARRFHP